VSIVRISGYAATFDPYPAHGGPEAGGWTEQVDRGALEQAVAAKPRVPLKVGDVVIGEAELSVDDTGLKMEAAVNIGYEFRVSSQDWDAADTDDGRVEMAARKITSMSFEGFSISPSQPGPDDEGGIVLSW